MEVITKNATATQRLGEETGRSLMKRKKDGTSTVLLLSGELGSGKTTFVQGLAKGLGIPHRILSPTYIFQKQYELPHSDYKIFYHIDLYRVKTSTDLEGLGITELLMQPDAIIAIEWPERLGNLAPKQAIRINCVYEADDARKITIIHPLRQ